MSVFPIVAASAAQVSLAWDDNSWDETGFKIERADSGGAFVQIATVGADVTTYVDTTAVSGTEHSYRVRAYNVAGDSGYSNVVTNAPAITTQPAASQSVPAFSAVSFTVVGTGVPLPGYQWKRNGSDIGGATSATLALLSATAADAGTYTVVVANGVPPSVTSNDAVLTITKVNQTISFGSLTNKVYGDPAFAVAATATSTLGVTFSVVSGPATVTAGGTVTLTGTGTIVVRASQGGDANYNPAPNVDQSFTVTKAPLTVTANAASRAYGSADPAFTATITGFVNGETLGTSGVTGSPSFTNNATAASAVGGSYAITPATGTLAAPNYSFTFANGPLAITKAPLTVTADPASRTYGAADPIFAATITGFVNGETIATSGVSGSPSFTSNATATSVVGGSYAITPATGTLVAPNYSFTFANGPLSITKAPLTVTADPATRAYGAADPALSATITGFVNGETLATSSVSGSPSFTNNATATSPVGGSYAITPAAGTMTSNNYSFTFANGVLSVTKAPLTVTADAKSRAYGAVDPTFTATTTGFVNGETPGTSGVAGAPSFTNNAFATSAVGGTYSITPALGSLSASNYSFTFANGVLSVTKVPLTVTAVPASRAYGAADPTFAATLTGFANGETLGTSGVTGNPSFTNNATVTSAVGGSYAITPATGTLAAPNYSFTFANGPLTIAKAPLTVTADARTRIYGAANPAFTATLSGFVNGETLVTSGVTGTAGFTCAANATSGVGSYAITPAQGGLSAGNYFFGTMVDGTLTVTKAPLTVTADSNSRALGASNPSFTATVSGFVNGDTSVLVRGAAAFSTPAIVTSGVGPYALTPALGTLDADNYAFTTFVDGTLTITPAALTITAEDKTRVYGGFNPALTYTITGFVNGDTIAVVNGAPVLGTAATTTTAVGTYPITVALGSLATPNYSFTLVPGSLAVTQATLTVTADDKSRDHAAADPAFTMSYAGFVNADTAASLTTAPTASTTTTGTSNVGTYPIVPAGGVSANYTLVYVNGTLTITQATPTVAWSPPAAITFGTTLSATQLNATASVPGAFVYSPAAGTVLNAGAGQPLNVSFNPTDTVNFNSATGSTTLTVNPANQAITFGALGSKTFGDPSFSVSAAASSILPVTFSIVSGPATATGANGSIVTLTGAGTVVVRASQSGNSNFNTAPPIDQSFSVAKATPVVSWPTPAAISFGTALSATQLNATASVPGTFVYTPPAATVLTAGAAQALNLAFSPTDTANYNSANGTTTITVNPAAQTITFAALANSIVGDAPFTLSATASSGLTVVFASSNPSVATVSGNTVTVVGPGTTNITASQAGNSNTLPATDVVRPLTVLPVPVAPLFTINPANQSVTSGANASFTVAASGSPTPTLQWQISTNNGTSWSNLTASSPYSGVTTATLSIAGATVALNSNQYRCTATNAAGTVNSSAATLIVNAAPTPPPPSPPPPAPTESAPSINTQPASQIVVAPGTATFSVAATGTSLGYQWRKDGANLSGANGSSLSIGNATSASAGSYSVLVFNSIASVASASATLTVETVPAISTQPAGQTVDVGANATFSVVATGVPTPTYQWRKNGTAIPGALGASLALTGVSLEAAGSYSVVVSNSHGSVTSSSAALLVNQVSFAGSYFGTFPDGGSWALFVRADNTATYLAFLPGSSTAIVTELTINPDGTFSISGSTIAATFSSVSPDSTEPPRAASSSALPLSVSPSLPLSVSPSLPLSLSSPNLGPGRQAAALPFTLSGKITNGQITGSILGQPLTGSADTGSGSTAGVYKASALLVADGATYSIVGPSGKALVVTTSATAVDGAVGTLNASGQLSTATASGAQLAMTVNPDAKSITATYAPAGGTVVSFSGSETSAPTTAALANLSIRSNAGVADQTLIVGFVVDGGSKPVLVRGIGPGLVDFGVTGVLADPRLDLFRSGSAAAIATNDNWTNTAADVFTQVGAFALTTGSRDAAVVTTLEANAYTARLTDVAGATGIALLELYDTAPGTGGRLVNVSARAQVGTGGAILIAGFNVSGTGTRRLLLRAVGPTLVAFGVGGVLADPRLDLFAAGNATPIASNDNWEAASASAFGQVGAFNLNAGSKDSVLLVSVSAGSYTAQISGVGGTSGVALVEIYEVP